MEKKLILIIALFCCLSNAFASYTPINITSGFNADVVANGVGSSANSCVPFDVNNGDALVAPDWMVNAGDPPPEFSLPASGIINSNQTAGLSFNLASYSANNVLLLTSTQTSGTIALSGTGYGELFLLVAGSAGNINFSATVNFSDGSNQVVSNLTATEWKSGTAGAINGIGAVRIPQGGAFGDNVLGDMSVPSLYQVGLNIDPGNVSKTITGITFSGQISQSSQSMGVFAVTGVSPCSGAPAAANVLSNTTSVCSGTSFTLSLNTNYVDAGINYQWQKSPDNVNWTTLTSAGNQATVTLTQSSANYYRCIVSCSFSNMSTTSTSVMVGQNAALDCYCTPIYTQQCDGTSNSSFINSVLLNGANGTSLNNAGTGCSPSSYADYTTSVPPVSLSPLQSYNLALTASSAFGDDPYVAVWIDMNDDGFFDNATEKVGTTSDNTGVSLTLAIPLSTATGNHRMRIRATWYSNSGVTSPCDEFYMGETEDYTIHLLPPPSCIYPVGFSSTPQSLTSTQLSWISNSATSYDYVLDQNNANTPVSGSTINNTTDTFVNLSGLISGTDYYLHVRARCSATDSSVWFAFPFSIADPCGATALTIGMPFEGDNSLYPSVNIPTSCGTAIGGNIHAKLFKFISTTGNAVKISTCGTYLNNYFRVYSGDCNNFTCVGGSSTDNSCGASAQAYTFQPMANTTYYVLWGVSGNFSTGDYTIEVFETAQNDDAPGATLLTLGAGCSGPVYSNQSGTASANEPITNCSAFDNSQPIWFKFIAPASGNVRISTDGAEGTMNDSRIGLFSATDSSDYSTFNLLSCDDDNGVIGDGLKSIIYATDLTPGTTYYVQVDNNTFTSPGTFCLTVDDLNAAMLTSSDEDCNEIQTPTGFNEEYKGWVTLADDAGKLVALVKNPSGGNVSDYSGSLTIKTGAARQTTTGDYYLNRNYLISNGSVGTPVDLKLFFTTDEFANFNSALAPMLLMANMSDLYVLKQSGYTCAADIDMSLGALETLNQVSNNTTNGVGSIQVSTSSFSNFYISGSNFSPLAIKLKSIEARNKGAANQINWTTATEEAGDHFELERGADGKLFSSIAKINAHQKPSDYVYFDNAPLSGINYYRLKMMDIKGNTHYSKVVQANVQGDKKIMMDVYPNPVNKSVNLRVFGTQNGTVSLTDISGRVISTSKMTGSEMQIDMSTLSNGFYLIHYSDENFNQVVKVNKQ